MKGNVLKKKKWCMDKCGVWIYVLFLWKGTKRFCFYI